MPPILFGPLPPPYGGVSVFMSALADAAAEGGLTIWSYAGEPQEKHGGETHFLNHRRFEHIWKLLRRGRAGRIADSTHFHLEYPHPILLPLWLLAKFFLRFRWIKLLHDGSLPARFQQFDRSRRLLFRNAIRGIDEIVVANSDLENWLRRVAKFEGKISVIPPLLPLPRTPEQKAGEALAEKLTRFTAREKRICSLGVFIPDYGFAHVAEAIQRLREESRQDIGLLLIDARFADDHNYRETVLNGRDWIEIVENVPHPHLARLFSGSDVFVRATKHESLGLSRIEALWAGTPVIATNVGETRGMLLYEFGDIGGLCGQIGAVFAGDAGVDIAAWAETFRNEAIENLENYLNAITGDSDAD